MQAETRRLVRLFALVGIAVSVLAVLLYGLMRGGWLDAILAGIALGMSMLPEELPVVLTVFMAMGAWRISLARVLTRRAAAIETLGSATVLCTDKTGTLTENRMSIVELRPENGEIFGRAKAPKLKCRPHPGPCRIRSARQRARTVRSDGEGIPCPRCASSLASANRQPHAGWTLAHAYGLRPDLLAVTHVWQPDAGRQHFVVAAKGAPEAIAGLCRLGAADRAALTQSIDAMASAGLRVLGVARGSFMPGRLGRIPARIHLRVSGTGRPCRSAACRASSRRSATAGRPASRR